MGARIQHKIGPVKIGHLTLEAPVPPRLLDLPTLFGDPGPVELEVGFGKGRFLVTAAQTCPDVNWLGVEIRHILRDYTATRLAKRGLTNARVAQGDARSFLADCLPDGSLQAIHFYFPDPWWKKRHAKRRVWIPDVFAEFARCLEPGGRLLLASDVPQVFGALVALARERPELDSVPFPEHVPLCSTNFEDKARTEGRRAQRAAFERQYGAA